MTPRIYVASAGTGKTTKLLDVLEGILEHTIPERVIYTTYTNAGANEAVERAMSRFPFSREQFRHFRTLHSLCYRNTPHREMLGRADYREFSDRLGYSVTGMTAVSTKDGAIIGGMSRGDRLLALENLRRNTLVDYRTICDKVPNLVESPQVLEHFSKSYEAYKKEIHKIDFTDQIMNFLKQNRPLDVDYLIVDEAQDLSRLQWRVLHMLSEMVKEMHVAGDDKQAIYEFSGASPDSLIEMEGDREVLGTCYRLPPSILEYSQEIASRIQKKTPYTVESVEGAKKGSIHRISDLSRIDMSKGTWLLLARNRCFLEALEQMLISKNLLFKSPSEAAIPKNLIQCIEAWISLEKGFKVKASLMKIIYRNFLKTGSKVARGFKNVLDAIHDEELLDYEQLKRDFGLLTAEPWWEAFGIPSKLSVKIMQLEGGLGGAERIEVATIHGAKGREADCVVVLPDMAWTTWKEYEKNPDTEHRTFYVACTRAKKELYLMQPITNKSYEFPEGAIETK